MKNVAAILTLAYATNTMADPGNGPMPPGMTTDEQIDWIVQEIGHSEDGLTIRGSIEATDYVVFGAFGVPLVLLIAYVIRIRILLAKAEGRTETDRGTPDD